MRRFGKLIGKEVDGFYQREASRFLSGKVIPIQAVPKMYICMDGIGIPVVKAETMNRKGQGEAGQSKTREVK